MTGATFNKCPQCGKPLPASATFCTRCGMGVQASRVDPFEPVAPRQPARPRPAPPPPVSPSSVLSYQVPEKLDPRARQPARRESGGRGWVWIAIAGTMLLRACLTWQGQSSRSTTTPRYTTPPRYVPPPRIPATPSMPGNTFNVPNPNAPRQIPGTSMWIDNRGHVTNTPPPSASVAPSVSPAPPVSPSSAD